MDSGGMLQSSCVTVLYVSYDRPLVGKSRPTHRFTTASYTPMEILNIDTIGPVDRDSADNCYILVAIDCFTRFVELYPVSDTSALPCARALLSHVCRYGTPMTIRVIGVNYCSGKLSTSTLGYYLPFLPSPL